jgi:hypothetical protein
MLVKEIIVVYSENHRKPINKKAGFLIVEGAGTYSYHSVLKEINRNCSPLLFLLTRDAGTLPVI